MIARALADADFDNAFPNIFGDPERDDPGVGLRNENGLLLRKAHLHIKAVLRANETDNLHSMAVQMRVVLECAAQIKTRVTLLSIGSQDAFARILNETESDYVTAILRASRGQVGRDVILKSIAKTRGQPEWPSPRRVSVTDRIQSLYGGSVVYDHLSEHFCRTAADALAGPAFNGGVLKAPKHEIDHASLGTLNTSTTRLP